MDQKTKRSKTHKKNLTYPPPKNRKTLNQTEISMKFKLWGFCFVFLGSKSRPKPSHPAPPCPRGMPALPTPARRGRQTPAAAGPPPSPLSPPGTAAAGLGSTGSSRPGKGQPGLLPGPARPARTCCCRHRRRAGAGPGRAALPPALKAAAPEPPRPPLELGPLLLPVLQRLPRSESAPCSVPGLAPLPMPLKGFSERRAPMRPSPVFTNVDKNPRGKTAITHVPAEWRGK